MNAPSTVYLEKVHIMATAPARTRKSGPPVPPPAVQKAAPPPDTSATDLLLAATAIFDGGKNTFTARNGKEVTIYPARMEHISRVMMFFGGVVSTLDPSSFAQLIDSVVHAQKMAIANGEDPSNVDLRELASDELVNKAFGHTSLLAMLFSSVFELLPSLVEAFTNVTEAEYRQLEPDEGMLIAGGIFLLNYRFFTQSLLPMLTAFMKSWVSKKGSATPGALAAGTKTKKATK